MTAERQRQKGFPGSFLNLENKSLTKSKENENYDKRKISQEFISFFLISRVN